jgi:hypothetical protein
MLAHPLPLLLLLLLLLLYPYYCRQLLFEPLHLFSLMAQHH